MTFVIEMPEFPCSECDYCLALLTALLLVGVEGVTNPRLADIGYASS